MNGLQKLLRDFNNSLGGSSNTVFKAVKLLQDVRDAGVPYFSENKKLSDKLDSLTKASPAYLAHEYLNKHWTPMYIQDVFTEMESCKLTYVGSAVPGRNVALHSIPDQFRAIVEGAANEGLAECLKDMVLNTTFRQDIYVRGRTQDAESVWRDRMADIRLMLTRPVAEVKMEASIPRGNLQMGNPIYKQALDSMVSAPVRLGNVLGDIAGLHSTATVMLQTDWARPTVDGASDPTPSKALNACLARRSAGGQVPLSYACAKLGSGLTSSPQDRWLLTTMICNPDAPSARILDLQRELLSRTPSAVADTAQPESDASLTVDGLDARREKWHELELL